MATHTADDIRRRHGALHQKVRAFRLAVDEHLMNIQVRVEYNELVRPTSSVFRTPKYVQVLGKTLETDLDSLRNDLNSLSLAKMITSAESSRLESLIADLEKQLRMIHRKIATKKISLTGGSPTDSKRIRSAAKSARHRQKSAKKDILNPVISRCESPKVVQSNLNNNNDSSEGISDKIAKVRLMESDIQPCGPESESDSCSTLTLPRLQSGSPAKSTGSEFSVRHLQNFSPERNRRGILKRQRTMVAQRVRPPVRVQPKPPLEEKTEEKSKRVTFSNSSDERNHAPPMLFRQKTNVGYPFGSCFPALPPLPSRRRFAQPSSTMSSLQLPLKGAMYRKERSWMY